MLTTVRLPRTLSILLLLMLLGGAVLWSVRHASPLFAAEQSAHLVYIPAVQAGIAQEPQDPQEPQQPIGFFADTQWRTASASIATDAQGGKHLAYVYYQGLAEGVPNHGVYRYCARDCDTLSNWQGVGLGQEVNEIQLALTPQGRPRLLYRTRSGDNGSRFHYAACDANCADAANWQSAQIAANQGMAPLELSDGELPQRSFALDGSGRPRFIYNDRTPGHLGAYYTFCDDNCTDAANWREVRINKDNGNQGPYRDEDYYYPSLTFTPTGQPRALVDGVSMQDEFFLFYLACDADCGSASNWQSVPLFPRGHGSEVSYDLEVDAQGRPRLAYYDGAHIGGGGNVLTYAWCNNGCLQAANWQRSHLGLAALEGQEPDLELDSAGRPHIAYAFFLQGGLGYALCEANCEGTNPQWRHQVVESRTDLQAAWSVAHPPHCSGGLWDGLTPTLSLNPQGAAHIAYDVTYYARCHYRDDGQWEEWSEMNLVWRAVRVRIPAGSDGGQTPVTPTPVTPTPVTPTPVTPTPVTPTPVTPTPPLPARLGFGLFPESAWRTSSSDVAVDNANGIHLAYVFTEPMVGLDPDGTNNPTTAVYRTCQTGCANAQNWSSVILGEAVSEVQIGLTPAGKPRLLLLTRATLGAQPADRYVYAACDQNCTSVGGWQTATIATVPNSLSYQWQDDPNSFEDYPREYQARRYFALDPTGRPRFVYYHYNAEVDAAGGGAYYAACDAACTTPGNWTHTRVTEVTDWSGTVEWEILERPALAFTPDGQPRMLAAMLPLGILRFSGLYYIACDGGCDQVENWHKTLIGQNGDEFGDWDLAVDGAGRPHMVVAQGWGEGLRYARCDANCLDAFNWQSTQVEIAPAEELALVLNAQGQPRIAFKMGEFDDSGNNSFNSLYYLWCNGDCQTATAQWQRARVETSHHLLAEWPGSYPPACVGHEWDAWYMLVPSLALGPNGEPRIATDVGYLASCEYDPATGTWQSGEGIFNTVWRGVHIASFAQP